MSTTQLVFVLTESCPSSVQSVLNFYVVEIIKAELSAQIQCSFSMRQYFDVFAQYLYGALCQNPSSRFHGGHDLRLPHVEFEPNLACLCTQILQHVPYLGARAAEEYDVVRKT